jgi:hypothetical protein
LLLPALVVFVALAFYAVRPARTPAKVDEA